MSKLPCHPRCYNAGKISGLPYIKAYTKFGKADRWIEARCCMNAVNPMIHGLKPSRPWWMHLIYDLWLLSRCQAVALQQDWMESRGARIEYRVARFLRKDIFSL